VFYSIEGERVSLCIKAQPNASKSEFCEAYGDDAIKIRIKAPAVEGAANKELVKFLAKSFKVSKSDILKVDSKPLGTHNGFCKCKILQEIFKT
jgi:uncharacterized protein